MPDIWRTNYRRFRGLMLRLPFIIFAFVIVAGCQTTAQRQYDLSQTNIQEGNQKLFTCYQKIATNSAYQGIAQHIALLRNGKLEPTIAQQSDNGVPSDEDVQTIIALHNENAICREQAIENFMKVIPWFIPTLVQSYHAGDLITVDLIQRKITWGDANKRRVAVRDDLMVKKQAAEAQFYRDLNASHYAERSQQLDAINALSQWTSQQQTMMQNQRMINTLNRPVTTDCTGYGNSIHCTSH